MLLAKTAFLFRSKSDPATSSPPDLSNDLINPVEQRCTLPLVFEEVEDLRRRGTI